MSVAISGLYISLGILLTLFLGLVIVKHRRGKSIGLGDGGDESLQTAMRAQTNAFENVVMTGFVLALAEINGLGAMYLHIAGAVLIISRAWHAWGFLQTSGGKSKGRFYGTLMNWIVIIALCGWNVYCGVMRAVN